MYFFSRNSATSSCWIGAQGAQEWTVAVIWICEDIQNAC
jgi:hypothetical protein